MHFFGLNDNRQLMAGRPSSVY